MRGRQDKFKKIKSRYKSQLEILFCFFLITDARLLIAWSLYARFLFLLQKLWRNFFIVFAALPRKNKMVRPSLTFS